ncbi:EF-hand domain-containing protein [Hoeflea sp. YIM 152468]|uniref:EF-hand domain-containing protein n=1 Tax=Hoeflea sp. YIM 152468 TaxID=3031759 RepID=UPI0023D9FBF2|nr:EF-hand domain-containing protein [Hoeflea sp. YIM 152468]MDF1608290.1 EF-hand domain-containing protein [Hoeflea sp. YIM 152468]
MKKTLLATLAAAMIASVAFPAMAASQRGGHERGPRLVHLMERFDTNKDGAVDLEEVSAHRQSMFESADTDKSGSLSQDELKAFGDMRKEMRQQNREERRAEAKGMKHGKMGKHGDRDGRMAGKHDGKRHGEGKGRGEGRGDRRGGMKLERLDTDKNGEISLEEFASVSSQMFERFDRNDDKKIDITDFYRSAKNGN